jgi:hypothetical protein
VHSAAYGTAQRSFYETITVAVAEFATTGYVSEDRLRYWMDEIRAAAERDLVSDEEMTRQLRGALGSIFDRMVERGGLAREFRLSRFGVERLRPKLRDELSRRVMANAQLIRLNREEAIAATLRRFAGWATSVPPGGDEDVKRNVVKSDIRKSLASQPYVVRRLSTDQSHKFVAALREIVATDSGALAVVWRHIKPRPSYQSRPEHLARDGKVYAIRGNWALERGLMKAGPAGYYDEVTAFAEEPMCSCYGTWLTSLGQLPDELLTEMGRAELARVRQELAA